MRREADGGRLLNGLLDRFERLPDRTRRIISRASLSFESANTHHQFNEILMGARDTGAVELTFDREAPHLIDQVVLSDPSRLYTYLNRRPQGVQLDDGLSALAKLKPATDIGRELTAFIAGRWRTGKRALALSPLDVDEAARLVRAADAAFTELPGGRLPLRTRSARLLNDSKALERSLSKLLAFLKITGRVEPDLQREDALRVLGLEKFPQPLLLSGPLRVGNVSIENWTYVGLPPEAAEILELAGAVRSILTIENLESFNRHVRECRGSNDAVVYTGGFPSTGVIAVLRRLIELADVGGVWHWGDIDPGGIQIGLYLERMLPKPMSPHLMSPAIADAHGRLAPELKDHGKIPPASAFAPLAAYLAAPRAHWLEQETLDPEWVKSFGS